MNGKRTLYFFMSISGEIERLKKRLPGTMLRDRESFSSKLKEIGSGHKKKKIHKRLLHQLKVLERKLDASIEEREGRLARKPVVTYPKSLPIMEKRDEIIQAVRENQVVIISGETGSGKSTQIPKMCLEAGRGILAAQES